VSAAVAVVLRRAARVVLERGLTSSPVGFDADDQVDALHAIAYAVCGDVLMYDATGDQRDAYAVAVEAVACHLDEYHSGRGGWPTAEIVVRDYTVDMTADEVADMLRAAGGVR
jgi:hypothetical protein